METNQTSKRNLTTNKEMPFDEPLCTRDRNKAIEYLALEILQFCYPSIYNEFIVKDAPDICNKDGTIGVEVVEAITNANAKAQGDATKKFLNSKNNYKGEKAKEAEFINTEDYHEDESLSFITSDDEKNIFQNAIDKKMKKLGQYKNRGFKQLGLFVFYNEIPIPITLYQYKYYFEEILKKYDDTYDKIFLGCTVCLIEYEVNSKKISSTKIEGEAYNKLQYNARLRASQGKNPQISL